MQGTPKKLDVVKCVRDMRGYPPEFYRLPEDGRKWEHTCFMRRSLAMQLATYADGDGTNITVGVERLRQELGMAKRTFYRRIDELTRLGFIEKDGRTHMRGTAVRHINFEGIWEHAAGARVPDSAPECQIGTFARVPNSAPECQTAQARVPNSAARVPDSSTRVPLTADFGPEPIRPTTPTAFPDRGKKLPPNAGMVGEGTLDLGALPQTPALAAQADPVNDEDDDSDPEPTPEQLKADEEKYAQHEWELLMAGLPEVMQGAVLSEEQRKQLAAQLDRHGFDRLLAAMAHWIQVRDYPVGQCRTKWRAWLAEGDAAIGWIRQEAKRQRLKEKSNGN